MQGSAKVTQKRFHFFHEHAGWSTPPGRAVCALDLARAEQLLEEAEQAGVAEVVWNYDDIPYEIGIYTPEQVAAKFESNEWTGPFVCALKVNGDWAASLGGIVVGPRETNDPYCRVVVAELAEEIEDDIRQALGDARDANLAQAL